MKPNGVIALIGYRATGKTTLAKLLAERLCCAAVDSDVLVEHRAGKTIAEIFAENGENIFRDLESEVINSLTREKTERLVLATGGGAVLRMENRQRLRNNAFVVWLTASPETILRRMSADSTTESRRPSLTGLPAFEEIVNLLQIREPLYRETSHFQIDTESQPLEDLVDVIMQKSF